jgi:ketosteroid isomerase-like protein
VNIPDSDVAEIVLRFVDCINRGDAGGLEMLMAEDHELQVFDEDPLTGRETVAEAWRGYIRSFPRYQIYPHQIAAHGNRAAILGHTTGSHLGLTDDEESRLTLIWIAESESSRVRSWILVPDTAERRAALGLESNEER